MSVLSLIIRAFVPVATSFGWAWGPWNGADPLGQEELAEVDELPLILQSYASMTSLALRNQDHADLFNVTAFGAVSGLVYGRDQWLWVPDLRKYQEHGEPWVPRTLADDADLDHHAPVIHLAAVNVRPHLAA